MPSHWATNQGWEKVMEIIGKAVIRGHVHRVLRDHNQDLATSSNSVESMKGVSIDLKNKY